jgi:hypothetical protein
MFSINLNTPSPTDVEDVNTFLQACQIVPQVVRPHRAITAFVCEGTQEKFESIREFLINKNEKTLVVDLTDQQMMLFQQGYGVLVGAIKKAPEPITEAQVLTFKPDTSCTDDRCRNTQHPTQELETSKRSTSTLRIALER